MEPSDYLALKQRVLLAADVADLVARTPDKVRYPLDDETYALVYEAMTHNREDIQSLLAEIDMLRAAGGAELFPAGSSSDAQGDDAGDRGTVVDVPQAAGGASGDEVRPDPAGLGGEVPAGGLDGERPQRPKPRRHRKGGKGPAKAVDAGSTAEPMGGGEG
jgi:hypothetical protein